MIVAGRGITEMNLVFTLVGIFTCLSFVCSYIVEPGPVVVATKGEIWPKPKTQQTDTKFTVVRPNDFQFVTTSHTCDLLNQAFERYIDIMKLTVIPQIPKAPEDDFDQLNSINVTLDNPCEELPHLAMNESYNLLVLGDTATLQASSVWGILRGLESFSQLMTPFEGDWLSRLRINNTVIWDEPRFPHRGLLVDTSRHFITMDNLYKILDGMAYNKLNVFHWHLVDDHSFPYKSITFPELAEKGAFEPSKVYTQEDVSKIIHYARVRGIRVMPEIDTPGHTRSWGLSHLELLTACEGQYAGLYGPLDPTKDEVYAFLDRLFREMTQVFPDDYIHIGGDEVGFECWQSNSNITAYMRDHNITSYKDLEEIFIQRVVDSVDALNEKSIVWQEVYTNGIKLPNETLVHIWTGDQSGLLFNATRDGHVTLLSSCWYLDHLAKDGDWRIWNLWKKDYACDPHNFPGSVEQKALILGGEACMWAEAVDNNNVVSRIFPRVGAAAEKLWSQQEDVTNANAASSRLEEQYCRLLRRGVPSQPPNGPGYCPNLP